MLATGIVFLVCPMGSGMTADGRHLARMLRFTFHDSDADIEAKTGVDIAFIFEKEGEPGFRMREKESIERLTRMESIVLATGGGCDRSGQSPRLPSAAPSSISPRRSISSSNARHARHRLLAE